MSEHLVQDYLRRLERAAAVLPPDRRAELLEGITEHLAAARAAGAAADEAAVRTLLDRLGEPEDIVAAAREDLPPEPSSVAGAPVLVPRSTGRELAAVLLLTLGSFLPVVGWLAGAVLLWTSSLWRGREKLLGTLVVPLGPGGVLLLGALLPFGFAQRCTTTSTSTLVPEGAPPPPPPPDGAFVTGTCTSSAVLPGWAGTALTVLLVVAPVVVAVVLMHWARRRAAASPVPVLPPAWGGLPPSPWGPQEVAAVVLLGVGGLIVPLLGALVGLVLACTSPRWSGNDKLLAGLLLVVPLALVVPGVPRPTFLLGVLPAFLGLMLSGVLAAAYLMVVLPRRWAAPRPA